LVREALRILDGVEPEEVVCEGDGWSLVDPENVGGVHSVEASDERELPPEESVATDHLGGTSLINAMSSALDSAIDDGWALDEERIRDTLEEQVVEIANDSREPAYNTESVAKPGAVSTVGGGIEVGAEHEKIASSAEEVAFFAEGDAMESHALTTVERYEPDVEQASWLQRLRRRSA